MMNDFSQIEEGWDVFDTNGAKVGDVSEVSTDYFVVSKGFLFTTERFIPFSAVLATEHDRVYLRVTKDEIESRGWDTVPETGTIYGSLGELHEERPAE
jgi:hypothetical protein